MARLVTRMRRRLEVCNENSFYRTGIRRLVECLGLGNRSFAEEYVGIGMHSVAWIMGMMSLVCEFLDSSMFRNCLLICDSAALHLDFKGEERKSYTRQTENHVFLLSVWQVTATR
jgi:hypothetical protein